MAKRFIAATLVLFVACGPSQDPIAGAQAAQTAPLPDRHARPAARADCPLSGPLLAQMLMSATDAKVAELDKWLKSNPTLKGTQLQDGAVKAGFDASFVALTLFPQVVAKMAEQIAWTRLLGQAFAADKTAVFASIQKLRAQAKKWDAEEHAAAGGRDQDHVGGPGSDRHRADQSADRLRAAVQHRGRLHAGADHGRVIEEDDDADEAIAAGLIGFTAGIVMGAAMDNDYYYGPYGFHGGAYMYNDAWDDYYDHREDAREDWMDHREDLARSAPIAPRPSGTTDRTYRRHAGTAHGAPRDPAGEPPRGAAQRTTPQSAATPGTASQERRRPAAPRLAVWRAAGGARQQATQRSGSSDAFSGYSSGVQRAASARGQEPGSSRGAAAAAAVNRDEVDTHDQPLFYALLAVIGALRGTDREASRICLAGRRRQGARRHRQGRKPRCAAGDFGSEGNELLESSDPVAARKIATCSPLRSRNTGISKTPHPSQDARDRQRGVAVSGAARQRATDGDSTPPPARKKSWRAGSAATSWRRRDHPRLCDGAAALREQGHDGKPPGVREEVPERSRQTERLVVAGRAGQKRSPLAISLAQAAKGAAHGAAPAAPLHGYYFKILTAQGAAAPAAQRTTSSRARCPAVSRSSPGPRSTTSRV